MELFLWTPCSKIITVQLQSNIKLTDQLQSSIKLTDQSQSSIKLTDQSQAKSLSRVASTAASPGSSSSPHSSERPRSCRSWCHIPGLWLVPATGLWLVRSNHVTEMLQEALIVNPYEVSKVADYLHRYNTKMANFDNSIWWQGGLSEQVKCHKLCNFFRHVP